MKPELNDQVKTSIEISIRLLFLFLLIGICVLILLPFLTPVVGGAILAIAVAPFYNVLTKKLNGRNKLAATVMVVVFLLVVLVPSIFGINALIQNIKEAGLVLSKGEIDLPPPSLKVKSWPLIGDVVYNFWLDASNDLEAFLKVHEDNIKGVGRKVLKAVLGISSTVLQAFLAIIISGIMLAANGTREIAAKFLNKLIGERGTEITELCENTIRSVTKGILGVSIIQSTFLALVFYFAGIPYAGLWVLICFVIGVLQVPVGLLTTPIIVYVFSTMDLGSAIFWSILIAVGGLIDNVLKPILMGAGAKVPMLVIFLGALGGFISVGFLGLFTGAVGLSLGYTLLMGWLYEDDLDSIKHQVKNKSKV
ncbi:AI-2E family transporter [Reichenbachiella versicolor]|uniref:AI-2E family transporter n=1 Tax=Reichenbachiella versicolor TaxID=1821036 RepID=UPI000D6E79B8|nr:AI-2E family transporter [Reichenbachiella versicolor]